MFVGYNTNVFSGSITVQGGLNYGRSATYAQSGTAALYDRVHDHIQTLERWELDGVYGPFMYSSISVDAGEFNIENSADVSVGTMDIQGTARVTVDEDSNISSSRLTLSDSAVLAYQGTRPLVVEEVNLEDTSVLQGGTKVRLQIESKNIVIAPDAQVHVDGMGYRQHEGPGSPDAETRAGGSHGGLASGPSTKPVYGSVEEPVDFGSAGDFSALGGGALLLTVTDTLQNDGVISAQGKRSASGGSIWVDTGILSGSGIVRADGGNFGTNAQIIGAGAGGRVAIYTNNASEWTGTSTVLGGQDSNSAGSPIRYAGDGTVFFHEEIIEPIDPLLLQYAPVLYMHEDEDYFPMNVESFVNDSSLWSQDGIGDTLLRYEEDLTFEEFESIIQNEDTSNYYLAYSDPDNAKSIDLLAAKIKYDLTTTSGEATTTVYVHKMNDNYIDEQGVRHDFIVLQYWYFYAMNNWGKYQVLGNNHEGDWESVFIFLDTETENPLHVAYSAHHNDGVNDSFLQYGSVRRSWESDEVSKNNSKVNSFVSVGSHAMYPNAGTRNTGLGKDTSSILGFKISESVVTEMSASAGNLDAWMGYEGKWGTDTFNLGGDGPLSPATSTVSGHLRFHEPVAWAGIDQFSEFIITEPAISITSTVAQVTMQFTDVLQNGTIVTIDPHEEYVSFGVNVVDIEFLPRYYDFSTSLLNDTFEVEVTLTYTDEELVTLNMTENDLTIFYHNEVTDTWEAVEATVDAVSNTISFVTNHFSRYAIGVPEKIEYSLEELFTMFLQEVEETSLRSYQKRLLRRYLNITEKFLDRDTERAIRIAKRFIKRLERKIERWEVLTSEESIDLRKILGGIEDKQ